MGEKEYSLQLAQVKTLGCPIYCCLWLTPCGCLAMVSRGPLTDPVGDHQHGGRLSAPSSHSQPCTQRRSRENEKKKKKRIGLGNSTVRREYSPAWDQGEYEVAVPWDRRRSRFKGNPAPLRFEHMHLSVALYNWCPHATMRSDLANDLIRIHGALHTPCGYLAHLCTKSATLKGEMNVPFLLVKLLYSGWVTF